MAAIHSYLYSIFTYDVIFTAVQIIVFVILTKYHKLGLVKTILLFFLMLNLLT